jgi:protein TonB
MPTTTHLLRAPLGGKGMALVLSASMHAAVAFAAVRGAPHAELKVSRAKDSLLEIAALELAWEVPAQPSPDPKTAPVASPAHHHHDYAVSANHDTTAHDPALRHVLPLLAAASAPPASPALPDSTTATAPRFAMTVAPVTRAREGSNLGNATAAVAASAAATEPASEATVDSPAKLLTGGPPSYTQEAQAAGIEAVVPLEIVIDVTGAVVGARALAHVGYGLDEAALQSVRSYRFSPARRAGKALAVRMHWMMRFQLR